MRQSLIRVSVLEPIKQQVPSGFALLQLEIEASQLCEDTNNCRWSKNFRGFLLHHIPGDDFVGFLSVIFLERQFPGQKTDDIDRLEEFVLVAFREFAVIIPGSIVKTPLKEICVFLPLDFNVDGSSVISETNKVKDSLLAVDSIQPLFPVEVLHNIRDAVVRRQDFI